MGKEIYTFERIVELLNLRGEQQKDLHRKAALIRKNIILDNVYFRGIIEFSNSCVNDCSYCGIRKSKNVKRYFMSKREILDCVDFCDKSGYGGVVLQSGEIQTEKFTDFIIDILKEIKKEYPKIGITLCVGEQTKEIYKKFFEAGTHRYLLRIETSNEQHYNKLHPKEMSFQNRKKCLKDLKNIGFQVGTGVMIGSPFQGVEDLANDLLFFKEIDVDMVGMGPYIPYDLSEESDGKRNFNLGLNMIAVLRLMMPDVNIASTTALQAISPIGRELGLKAGANIIMPIVTPTKYRKDYMLYKDKPCINESSDECLNCVTNRVKSVGLMPKFGEWGDSKHYFRRIKNAC